MIDSGFDDGVEIPRAELTQAERAEVRAALEDRASGLDLVQARLAAAILIPVFETIVAFHRWRALEVSKAATDETKVAQVGARLSAFADALDVAIAAANAAADAMREVAPLARLDALATWGLQSDALRGLSRAAATALRPARPSSSTRGPKADGWRQGLEGAVADVLSAVGVPLTKYKNGVLARCIRVVYQAATGGLRWPSDPKDVLRRLLDREARGETRWHCFVEPDGSVRAVREN